MMYEPLVLGIETSCDETAIGIVRGRTLLANVIASSVEEHARFGGVVPEIASRAHLEAMLPSLQQAVIDAKISLSDIDAVAVTAGPGLIGALLVGVASASGLALGLGKPLYGVNHLAAHVCVDLLTHDLPREPTIALLVSGGHSSLLQVDDITSSVIKLGESMDDAAGEAFDKIARVMGEMQSLGAPVVRVVDCGDHYMALEGVHRLEAAARLGIAPNLIVLDQDELVAADSLDWQDLQSGESYAAGELAGEINGDNRGGYRIDDGLLTLVFNGRFVPCEG